MDRKEYLNQISAKPTPTQKGLPAFFTSKYFWIVIACVIAIIALLGIGSAISGSKEPPENRLYSLLLQVDNVHSATEEYQNIIKSSTLRGYATSLNTILATTSGELTAYVTEVYKYNPKKLPEKLQAEATQHSEELSNELFEAKITGNLDEIFDLKMVYEISLILNQEDAILKTAKNEALVNMLTNSYNNLMAQYTNFDEWSIGM